MELKIDTQLDSVNAKEGWVAPVLVESQVSEVTLANPNANADGVAGS